MTGDVSRAETFGGPAGQRDKSAAARSRSTATSHAPGTPLRDHCSSSGLREFVMVGGSESAASSKRYGRARNTGAASCCSWPASLASAKRGCRSSSRARARTNTPRCSWDAATKKHSFRISPSSNRSAGTRWRAPTPICRRRWRRPAVEGSRHFVTDFLVRVPDLPPPTP